MYQASLAYDGLDEDGRADMIDNFACTDCHSIRDLGTEDAPDLAGYGSREWIAQFIADPAGDRFYGRAENDRMPAFAGHPGAAGRLLTDAEIDLLARFIRGEKLD